MNDSLRSRRLRHDDVVVTLFLVVGLFYPTSINGEANHPLMAVGFSTLLILMGYIAWNHGVRPRAVVSIALPIPLVLGVCTFAILSAAFPFDVATFVKFCSLAVVLVLNLRSVRPGRLVSAAFFLVNVIWIVWGAATLYGNDWLGEFMTSWYTQFYSDLVSSMLILHKPVFTFGTHSLAGFFTYLFFWLNWEDYKSRRKMVNAIFAACLFVLLIGLTSFTSLTFAAVAAMQVGFWLWKHSRRILFVSATGLMLAVLLLGGLVTEEFDALGIGPQAAGLIPSSDTSGLLARYGSEGALRGTMEYILNHPLAPIGFTYPSSLFLGDSGPLLYILMGSIPLLLLIYVGLYLFLRHNLPHRDHALWLFFVFLAFEIGFNAMPYFRTMFLLPFVVVYAREIIQVRSLKNATAS